MAPSERVFLLDTAISMPESISQTAANAERFPTGTDRSALVSLLRWRLESYDDKLSPSKFLGS